MQGKYPDTAVGRRIPGDYAFMNEIAVANMQGMIHGRHVIFPGVVKFIHIGYHEFFKRHPMAGSGRNGETVG